MNALLKVMVVLLTLVELVFSEVPKPVLHVSTIPSHADIYVNTTRPDHSDKPDYQSPSYIEVGWNSFYNGKIMISLFKPEFRDTTINVTLSAKDTSYLIVNLTPVYEESIIEQQNKEVAKRSRKDFGRKMMFFSAIPFVVGGLASLATLYEIDQANEAKEIVEESLIATSGSFKQAKADFKEHKDNAKVARKATFAGLIAGAALLSLGFIISF